MRDKTTCSQSEHKSPVQIPNKNVVKCSLLCSMEFIYPQAAYTISIVSKSKRWMRWKLKNVEGGTQQTELTRTDLKYNSAGYQLSEIEFFLPSIHTMSSNEPSENRHDVEMVLKHEALASRTGKQKWLNVSVFVTPMYTYSISQDFFEQLIQPLRSKNAVRKLHANTDLSEGALPITVSDKWNPYQGIPHSKSFYIYKGDFPYAPCRNNSGDEIVWVIMENTLPIHFNEYEVLRDIVVGKTNDTPHFAYNGSRHRTHPLSGRVVYYNDGSFVQGSSTRNKFYVKCVKKEQRKAQKNLSFASGDPDDIGSMTEAYEKRTNLYPFYNPMQSFITPVMLSALFTIIVLAIFYKVAPRPGNAGATGEADEMMEESETGGANKNTKASLFLILMVFGFVFLHAMTFVSHMLLYSKALASVVMSPLLLIFGYWVLNKGKGLDGGLSVFIQILGGLLIVAALLLLGIFIVYEPLSRIYSYGVETNYNYYYVENEAENNELFYIGYRVGIVVNFNNIEIRYRDGSSGDDSMHASQMRGKFITFTLEQLRNTFENQTDVVENRKLLKSILQSYETKMKQNNQDPYKNFMDAAWLHLKPLYSGKDYESMVTNIERDIPEVLKYIDTSPLTNECVRCIQKS